MSVVDIATREDKRDDDRRATKDFSSRARTFRVVL
jgi:hypothetical protein